MYYDYENKKIELASKKAEKYLDLGGLTFDIAKNVSLSSWWNQDQSYDYYVDNQCGSIILEHYDEELNIKDTEIIGDFRSHYFYKYGPEGNLLDMLDSADSIDGDLCLALSSIKHSKKWKELYEYTTGVLNIDRFYIEPKYRGKKFGYIIFPVLIDVLSKRKDSLITIIPEPVNDMVAETGKEESAIKGTPEYRRALSKMQTFIRHFGFEQVEKEQVWGAALMDEGFFSFSSYQS